jgi:hypothetical protein
VPAPLAREIAYNAVGPISALGFRSPTLAQLMARYATIDPTLSSITADKRQGLSLIAPPTVLTVKIRQPSHEFTFGVGMSFIPYPLVLTPVV